MNFGGDSRQCWSLVSTDFKTQFKMFYVVPELLVISSTGPGHLLEGFWSLAAAGGPNPSLGARSRWSTVGCTRKVICAVSSCWYPPSWLVGLHQIYRRSFIFFSKNSTWFPWKPNSCSINWPSGTQWLLYMYYAERRDIRWNIGWGRGIFQGIRLYFTVYPNLSQNTDIINL